MFQGGHEGTVYAVICQVQLLGETNAISCRENWQLAVSKRGQTAARQNALLYEAIVIPVHAQNVIEMVPS